ncbi:MAG: sigma-70 family RNA polymerase sigma factor [Vicinamibacterales bacterium]
MSDMGVPPFRCVLDAWTAPEQELHAFLLGQVHDPTLADDLLQDVFLKAIRAGQHFCTLDSPRAWLFQVTRNAVVDQHRLRKSVVPVEDDLAAPVATADPIDELAQCIERALDALAPDDRDILQHCDLEGQTQREYADARGLNLPAAKARIQRARVRLRQHIVEQCGVRFDDEGRVCCHGVDRSPTK